MSDGADDERCVLVDASVFITLVEIDALDTLLALDGRLVVPPQVNREITDEPASTALASASDAGDVSTVEPTDGLDRAAEYLAGDPSRADRSRDDDREVEGDVALLAIALRRDDESGVAAVVVTDDKPLRKACKTLSIPVSGSIGVLVRAVERGDLAPTEATDKLYAMDEVGARLSASLVRKAERLIDEAGEK